MAVRAPVPQTAAAREEGRLRVCGFHLVAEATRERRLDHRSSWSRTLRLAVLVEFIALALVVHAAVVALHAVLVVEIGMLRKHARQLRPFPSVTLPTTTESYDIEYVVGSKPMAPTPGLRSDRNARLINDNYILPAHCLTIPATQRVPLPHNSCYPRRGDLDRQVRARRRPRRRPCPSHASLRLCSPIPGRQGLNT